MTFIDDPDDDQNLLPLAGADNEVDAVSSDITIVLLS
jgi:hypothetical protein